MNLKNEINCTLVVCTYNRGKSLETTLESLFSLDSLEDLVCEIIIVDNNSSDGTKKLIEKYIKLHGRLFRYVFESQQGVSFARNAGIKAALGEIIVFTDDDVIVEHDWLNNIWKNFKEYDCDAMGGRILPLYLEPPPLWIKNNEDLLGGPIVSYNYGEAVKIFDSDCMVPFVGANMAFKKKCFDELGNFRTDLGPSTGTMGDDTEFFLRLFNVGKKLYYAGNALVWHRTGKSRMNLRYLAKWFIAGGRYLERMKWDSEIRSDNLNSFCGFPLCYVKVGVISAISLILVVLNKRKFLKKWNELFCSIGMIIEYRKNSFKK